MKLKENILNTYFSSVFQLTSCNSKYLIYFLCIFFILFLLYLFIKYRESLDGGSGYINIAEDKKMKIYNQKEHYSNYIFLNEDINSPTLNKSNKKIEKLIHKIPGDLERLQKITKIDNNGVLHEPRTTVDQLSKQSLQGSTEIISNKYPNSFGISKSFVDSDIENSLPVSEKSYASDKLDKSIEIQLIPGKFVSKVNPLDKPEPICSAQFMEKFSPCDRPISKTTIPKSEGVYYHEDSLLNQSEQIFSENNFSFKKYYLIKPLKLQFEDYIQNTTNPNIYFIEKFNDISEKFPKIIPILISQNTLYYKYSIFNTPQNTNYLANIKMLNNKSMFAEFMMNNFNKNIPLTYYYNYKDKTYISKNKDNSKKIQKANNSVSGKNINIIYKVDVNLKDVIVSKYHQHSIFYVGHYLVKNGNIIRDIYLSQKNNDPNYIHKGAVKRYTVLNEHYPELDIFNKIFKKLNYTGFACSDFIIENDNVLVFEINPRIGGSMRKDKDILNFFWNTLVEHF